jgi:hypothetical protein
MLSRMHGTIELVEQARFSAIHPVLKRPPRQGRCSFGGGSATVVALRRLTSKLGLNAPQPAAFLGAYRIISF